MLPDSNLVLSCSTPPIPRRLRVEFQWFLMALSVLPGRSLAMAAHLFPWIA